jgi:hypothetical protein
MNKLYMSAITLVIGLALNSGASAANMSKDQYKAEKDGISAAYKSDKDNCKSMSGNAKDICMAEASGKEKVAKAELEANYKPSDKARRKVRDEKVEANYKVAMGKCNDKGGNLKDVCVKEAEAAMKSAKADAKANKKVDEARKDATEEKRDAEYSVARKNAKHWPGLQKTDAWQTRKRFTRSNSAVDVEISQGREVHMLWTMVNKGVMKRIIMLGMVSVIMLISSGSTLYGV